MVVERQPVDGARFPRQGEGAAGARRQAGRDRSAPHRDRAARRPAHVHPPRRRRVLPARHRARAVRGEPGAPRPPRAARRTASTQRARPPSPTSRPSAWRRAAASRPATIRELARTLADHRARRRVRPHRHLHAGVRHARELARSTCINVLTGHLDEPGGAMFPKAAAFAANTLGTPGQRQGHRRPAAARSRVSRRAGSVRRAADDLPGRGDRDAGRRARSGR